MDEVVREIVDTSDAIRKIYQTLKEEKETTGKEVEEEKMEIEAARTEKTRRGDELMRLKNKNQAKKAVLDAKAKKVADLKKRVENAKREAEGFQQMLG